MPTPRLPRSGLLLSAVLGLLGACGFGDDRRFGTDVDAAQLDAPRPDAAPIDAALTAKVFEVVPSPALIIPNNKPTGATVSFAVTEVTATTGLDVLVDVTHPYRGDIRIELRRGGSVLKTLKMISGGDSVDDIKETYPVSPAELGTPINSTYSVFFVDGLDPDQGTVNRVRLTFKVN